MRWYRASEGAFNDVCAEFCCSDAGVYRWSAACDCFVTVLIAGSFRESTLILELDDAMAQRCSSRSRVILSEHRARCLESA